MPRSLCRMAGRAAKSRALRIISFGNVAARAATVDATAIILPVTGPPSAPAVTPRRPSGAVFISVDKRSPSRDGQARPLGRRLRYAVNPFTGLTKPAVLAALSHLLDPQFDVCTARRNSPLDRQTPPLFPRSAGISAFRTAPTATAHARDHAP